MTTEVKWKQKVNAGGNVLSNLQDPTANQDAATKKYVVDYSIANTILSNKIIGRYSTGAGASELITPSYSITLSNDGKLILSGDVEVPGNVKYYGTNDSGTKGFFTFPDPVAETDPVFTAWTNSFSPESTSNKDTDSSFTANSDTKYPSQKAVKTALDLKLNTSAAVGGEASGTVGNLLLLNSAVLGKLLTGLNISGSSIAATDSIIQAFGKLQNQLNGVFGGAIFQEVYDAATNSPALIDGTGTKGHYYVVSVDGNRDFGSGTIILKVGDWVIYNGTIWQKVDNTDAVASVNGFIGAVNLTTADITEVTNLYFTTVRVLATTLTGFTSSTGIISATDTLLQAIQKLNGNIALKRDIITRIGTEVSSSTSTPNIDLYDQWNITALAVSDTIAAPTGTPVDGQNLIIRITDNGTAQALSWNPIYRASSDLSLPNTTVVNKTLYLGFKYNSVSMKWDLIALLNNF